MFRVWIKPDRTESVQKAVSTWGGRVHKTDPPFSDSTAPYVQVENPYLAKAILATIPADAILEVSWMTSICDHFPKEGIYTLPDDSRLVAEIRQQIVKGCHGDEVARTMEVVVTSPSIRAALDIYNQFRQGNLEPTKDWAIAPKFKEGN